MAAPKKPNPHAGGEVIRQRALRRKAIELTEAGWICIPPAAERTPREVAAATMYHATRRPSRES